jgi:hypothetical protein
MKRVLCVVVASLVLSAPARVQFGGILKKAQDLKDQQGEARQPDRL